MVPDLQKIVEYSTLRIQIRRIMAKKTYKIDGMHCTSCAMMIEGELEDAGLSATCSYQKQEVVVDVPDRQDIDTTIIKVIEKAGYKVTQ